MVPEDVRDFQGGTPHGRRTGGVEALQRTDDVVQYLGRYLGVERRGIELLVFERAWMMRMSTFCSSRWVAKLWRRVCIDTRLSI